MRRNKLKVAMIGQKTMPSGNGGIERVLTHLCPLLAARGIEVTCWNRRGETHGGYEPFSAREFCGVRLQNVPAPCGGSGTAFYSLAATVCACLRGCTILHYHAEGPAAALWLGKLLGKKCVVTVHGLDWQREKWKDRFAARYIRFGEKMLARHADAVIVLSRSAARYFKQVYDRPTTWIPNGADCTPPRPCRELQARFGLCPNDYFCTVCRLTPEKGLDCLIDAHRMAATGKKLVIAGGPGASAEYMAHLQKKTKNDDSILFTGFISGTLLEELYSNAFAFVLASAVEGMPLSLLEAMGAGCAVIGSDIDEITEVTDGCGLTFPCGDAQALARCMQKLCASEALRASCRQKSRQKIAAHYTWDKVSGRTAALYHALTREAKR